MLSVEQAALRMDVLKWLKRHLSVEGKRPHRKQSRTDPDYLVPASCLPQPISGDLQRRARSCSQSDLVFKSAQPMRRSLSVSRDSRHRIALPPLPVESAPILWLGGLHGQDGDTSTHPGLITCMTRSMTSQR